MIRVDLQKKLLGTEGVINLHFKVEIKQGGLLAIMGPSGAGKTTVLKMLAGLLIPDAGSIKIGEVQWYSKDHNQVLPPQKRSVGFVFQDYALFPNMNVRQNLEYALQPGQDHGLVEEVLALMNMEKLQQQKPSGLSGGQQQRVALARAVVRRPQLLLLDEPFAALDRQMREKLQEDLLRLHQRYGTTTVLVSHDAGEVARMADEVVYLEQGQIVRKGSPDQLLPVMKVDAIVGHVIQVNALKKTFVLLAKPAGSLWQFDLPDTLSVKKGDQLLINCQQGLITHLDG